MYNQTHKKMAKIYGLFGSMTGKLADTVMSVRNGEQIARKYQPIVSNPSTPAQIETRAKLKLISQLSAVMAPVIAIPRLGAVSSRNRFTSLNYNAVSYASNEAEIELGAIQLTKSVVSLSALVVSRATDALSVRLYGSASLDVSRVVYAAFMKELDNTLRYIGSAVSSTPGTNNTYETTIPSGPDTATRAFVVYAYGVRDNNEAATAIFGEMTVPTAESVASVVVTRRLTESDITLTETQFAALDVQE